MNVLILGDGPEELAWARAVAAEPEHALVMACPGLNALPGVPATDDLDAALAAPGVDAAVVGGYESVRAEALRRAAAEGLAILALHPPGPNADPYYQVALSRQETGAHVVPDLPLRLHPGVAALEKAIADGSFGVLRSVRFEAALPPNDPEADLLGRAFPRVVDLVRALLGEVETLTATGTPPGPRPRESLIVHLRGPEGRAGEVRLEVGPAPTPGPARLVVSGTEGSMALEFDPEGRGPSRLVRRDAKGEATATDLGPWDPRAAVLRVLADAVAGRPRSPDLTDGTRAMELAEAAGRSLRKGRTVDLLYEEVSELASFKAFMTGLGCGLLLIAPLIYALSRAGVALGLPWMSYLAWAILPVFVLFLLLQSLRLAARPAPRAEGAPSIERAPLARERES
jgi:myo-inositol 2-dehydrogenase/D-chiro-inositol 1-dehydrogenase